MGKTGFTFHVFSTFLYIKLIEGGCSLVEWLNIRDRLNVFARDLLLFPINLADEGHWTLVVFLPASLQMFYVNSMVPLSRRRQQNDGKEVMASICKYLDDEASRLRKAKGESDGGDVGFVPSVGFTVHIRQAAELCGSSGVPQQANGYDCGVFVCAAILQLTRRCQLALQQQQITEMRTWLVLCLAQARLFV